MGKAKVVGINSLKQALSVELSTGAIVELPINQITWN
jgi:hypothetical protein